MLPYTITIKIVALKRKLTEKELVDADLASHPAWKAPKPKCNPLDMFCQLCKAIDKNAVLKNANYCTDLYAVCPEIEFDDADPNSIMLHLGTAAKACGSKKAKQGVIASADFCKDFHYFMMMKVYEKDGRNYTVDMLEPAGNLNLRSEYSNVQELMKIKPHQKDIEDFIRWVKQNEGEPEEEESGFMTAKDFFG